MLSEEEHGQQLQMLSKEANSLNKKHQDMIGGYRRSLKSLKGNHINTLDGILEDIKVLEEDPAQSTIAKLKSTAMRIKELESFQDYVVTAVKIHELTDLIDAQSSDLATVSMALDGFEQLILLHSDLMYEQLKLKLADIIASTTTRLEQDFQSWLGEVMGRVGWPKALSGDSLELLLLTCQSYRLFELITNTPQSDCIAALVNPLAAQFHFHFSCDRPTNRLDKPEWAFEFLLGICEEHREFFTELDELVGGNSFMLFIDELVQVARDRLLLQKDSIMDNLLLPNTVEQIVNFGEQLSELYGYSNATKTLLDVFLSSQKDISSWIELEKSRLLDAYEDGFSGLIDYANIDSVIEFLPLHYDYLRSLGIAELQSELLVKVTLPVLEQLLHKLEFDIPAFVNKPADVILACRLRNFCTKLKTMIGVDWGEDLSMISLAQTQACQDAFGYDPSGKIGTVFWRAVEVLHGIEDTILGRLYSYLKDGPMSLLARWSSAMHYSKAESHSTMHDSLRQALIEIPQRASLLKEHLQSAVFLELFARFVKDLEDAIHLRLVLRNYFTISGSEAFSRDLDTVESVLNTVHPGTTLTEGKLRDCVFLLKLPEAQGAHSAMVLKRLLQNDKLSEATRLLDAIGVEKLTLSECEQVLASRH